MNDHSEMLLQQIESMNLHRTIQDSNEENTHILSPSKDTYGALIYAFEFFNQGLFSASLPNCIITLPQGRRAALGYFCGKSWGKASQGDRCDEIALNPAYFQDHSTERVLSTLVHEMVHLQQFHFYKPGKSGYHNKEWGRLMRKVGLIPSSTAQPGGDDIGRSVSHYIEEGGAFQRVCRELLQAGFVIPWHTITPSAGNDDGDGIEGDELDDDDNPTTKRKRASKTKYSCSGCRLNAWAKPDVLILCGTCQLQLVAAIS